MSTPRQILAAIFDMDGLLIDSEPLWDRAELDVMASLGVDISRRNELPDTLGLRIDMVVDSGTPTSRGVAQIATKSPRALSAAPSRWWRRTSRYCLACVKRSRCVRLRG